MGEREQTGRRSGRQDQADRHSAEAATVQERRSFAERGEQICSEVDADVKCIFRGEDAKQGATFQCKPVLFFFLKQGFEILANSRPRDTSRFGPFKLRAKTEPTTIQHAQKLWRSSWTRSCASQRQPTNRPTPINHHLRGAKRKIYFFARRKRLKQRTSSRNCVKQEAPGVQGGV